MGVIWVRFETWMELLRTTGEGTIAESCLPAFLEAVEGLDGARVSRRAGTKLRDVSQQAQRYQARLCVLFHGCSAHADWRASSSEGGRVVTTAELSPRLPELNQAKLQLAGVESGAAELRNHPQQAKALQARLYVLFHRRLLSMRFLRIDGPQPHRQPDLIRGQAASSGAQ